jgi:hypothetical protein
MYIIAKVLDGKIIDIYNQKTYKLKKNAFTVLNGYHYVGVLPDYRVYHLTGLEEVVQ